MAVAAPAAIQLTCPRCRALRAFVAIDGQGSYRCKGCEWFFTVGTPSVATPAVPASTVAAVNTTGTVVRVTITGGTLTVVSVNGTQVGTTPGTYLVPDTASTISITYTVAPTWAWALPVTSGAVAAGATALPVASGGAYFTAGMQLVIDTGTAAEVVTVQAGATATSIPVSALVRAHGSGAVFGTMSAVPTYSGTGQGDAVIPAPPWGF